MIVSVKVKPNSREDKVEKVGEKEYIVSVREQARKGKANLAVIKLLSKHFGVSFRNIKIKNPTSRKKTVEILTE